MYKAMDVAKYIVNYLDNKGKSITNLKLQKIFILYSSRFFN